MKIFLLSESLGYIRENEIKVGGVVDKHNDFENNLKKSLEKCDNFLFVCNEPNSSEIDYQSAQFLFEALKKSGMPFKNLYVLDNSTKSNAKELIENADLIFLQGGKIPCQLNFLKEINLKKNILNSNAVICGKSAGAMNLARVAYNYPEDDSELGQPRWLKCLGLHDYIIIPHFNLEKGNEFCFGTYDVMNDFYIPDSEGKIIYALPQGSYIFIDGQKSLVFGEAYILKNRKIYKICNDSESKIINDELFNNLEEINVRLKTNVATEKF